MLIGAFGHRGTAVEWRRSSEPEPAPQQLPPLPRLPRPALPELVQQLLPLLALPQLAPLLELSLAPLLALPLAPSLVPLLPQTRR